ncbi:MAG: bifunctional DNA primase/polymerase, partial [Planctomycetota bacterium]
MSSSNGDAFVDPAAPELAYREQLGDVAIALIQRGLQVTVAEGKNPGAAMGKGWQNMQLKPDEVEGLIARCKVPTVGVKLGPEGGIIDFDIDSPDEAAAFNDLFDGDPPVAPTYMSGREGGEHRWFRFDERLQAISQATVKYRAADGKQLDVRIGCGGKGAHSVAPPSRHAHQSNDTWQWSGKTYAWKPGCSLDDIPLPTLPERVVEKLLAFASAPVQTDAGGARNSSEARLAVDAMLQATAKLTDSNDGSKRLFIVACKAVEHDLRDEEAVAAIRWYARKRPFPTDWTDSDILARIRDAEKKTTRGQAIVFTNAKDLPADGESKPGLMPLTMTEVCERQWKLYGNWPRAVGKLLFIHDQGRGVQYLSSVDDLFGWLQSVKRVVWHGIKGSASKKEFHSEIVRTAKRYEAVEELPHFPALPAHYYACGRIEPGDGSTLERLID